MTNNTIRRVILMVDTESMGLRPDSIMREIALLAVDAEDPTTILLDKEYMLPLSPQEALGRKTYIDTVGWLMKAATAEKAQRILDNVPGDMEELSAVVRGFCRQFADVTLNRQYELWFRRPQHDVPMLVNLLDQLGMMTPWGYDTVNDVATVMNEVGLSVKSVPADPQYGDKHSARGDVHHQLACLLESRRVAKARHSGIDEARVPAPSAQKTPPADFSLGDAKLPGLDQSARYMPVVDRSAHD